MGQLPERTNQVPDSRSLTDLLSTLSPDMAVQCSNPPRERLTHLPSFMSTSANSSGYHTPRASDVVVSADYSSPRQIQPSAYRQRDISSNSPPHKSSPEPDQLQPGHSRKRGAFFNSSPDSRRYRHDSYDASHSNHAEPARKCCKLVDTDGWIEKSFAEASLMRRSMGEPDPDPLPLLTPPRGEHTISTTSFPRPSPALQLQHQYHRSPPIFSRSPDFRSGAVSRRASTARSTSDPSFSPAPSHATMASTSRRAVLSPPGSATCLSGFSELEISTRANSIAYDDSDCSATFEQVHNVPRVTLTLRRSARISKLEQLPAEVFMRIMMFSGYKEQVLLRQCSYHLYNLVDLDAIPWATKTAAILSEERYNPANFPKKPPKTSGSIEKDDEEDETAFGEETEPSTASKKGRVSGNSRSTKTQRSQGKTKAHPDTLGRWGCYYCYKILPAYYFEGQLLEDKEGRKAKNHSSRGPNSPESDKKVDMRVEYVQILRNEPGKELPGWLVQDKRAVGTSSGLEQYVRARMWNGVNCDDLRAYYKDITRTTHLVAPLRGVNPVFTPIEIRHGDSMGRPASLLETSPESPALPDMWSSFDSCRPLYRLRSQNTTRGEADGASYTYEIPVPGNSQKEQDQKETSLSQPVGRVVLPHGADKIDDEPETSIEAGDVISLRRVCIPCGTRYAVYRRDCNRKIISKTEEAWWVCDCPQVRLANRSTGCPNCKRKVIY